MCKGPQYLTNLLRHYTPERSLRSSYHLKLVIPKCKSNFGERAFEIFAPRLWNDLSLHIKNTDLVLKFRKSLKTYLFTTFNSS